MPTMAASPIAHGKIWLAMIGCSETANPRAVRMNPIGRPTIEKTRNRVGEKLIEFSIVWVLVSLSANVFLGGFIGRT